MSNRIPTLAAVVATIAMAPLETGCRNYPNPIYVVDQGSIEPIPPEMLGVMAEMRNDLIDASFEVEANFGAQEELIIEEYNAWNEDGGVEVNSIYGSTRVMPIETMLKRFRTNMTEVVAAIEFEDPELWNVGIGDCTNPDAYGCVTNFEYCEMRGVIFEDPFAKCQIDEVNHLTVTGDQVNSSIGYLAVMIDRDFWEEFEADPEGNWTNMAEVLSHEFVGHTLGAGHKEDQVDGIKAEYGPGSEEIEKADLPYRIGREFRNEVYYLNQ